MMEYPVFKAKILTKSSIKIANASLFEILIDLFYHKEHSMGQPALKKL